jgi:hypothetical protein
MMLDISSTHYANFLTPEEGSPVSRPMYGLAVRWTDLIAPLTDIMAEPIMKAKSTKMGLVNLRSSRPPSIHGQDPNNADLIRFRQELDAVNIPLEMVLIGEPIQIYVEFWEKTRTAYGEIGVSLSAIKINPSKIEIPSPFTIDWEAMKAKR